MLFLRVLIFANFHAFVKVSTCENFVTNLFCPKWAGIRFFHLLNAFKAYTVNLCLYSVSLSGLETLNGNRQMKQKISTLNIPVNSSNIKVL